MKNIIVLSILIVLNIVNIHNCDAKSLVVNLNEDNWRLMLKKEWMVEFYAPWCPACKNLAPTWEEYSVWADEIGVSVGKIDVTTASALSGRFFVTALPTIFHVIDGEFRQYRGSRDIHSLKSFLDEKKWETLETVSAWKQPDSIQMSIVSYFFKLSHFLKELNNQLLKDYGLPNWASYAIFAAATIFFGAVLGLILVCIIDFIFPPKSIHRQSFSESKENKQDFSGEDDVKGDDLEDENDSTSEGEKYSGSDSEDAPESDKNKSPPSSPKAENVDSKNGTPTSSPNVRKRKTRKAD